MPSARMTLRGMSSGVRPEATRATMPSITAWKSSSGTMPTAPVAYSGAAANAASSSVSISRRRGIAPSHAEDDRVAVEREMHRLVDRLEQRQRAEERVRAVARLRRHAGKGQAHVEPAAHRVEDERRRLAHPLLERLFPCVPRLVRIHHHMHGTRGFGIRLLHDPAAEGGGLFPVDMAEGVAAHVLAEGVDLAARPGPVRCVLIAFHRPEPRARGLVAAEPREEEELPVDADAPPLQEEVEEVAVA